MKQDFSNVTSEQLAQLFPVLLKEHDPRWKEYFLQEKAFLQSTFRDKVIRINHIGSSSVPGLIAKPTIDILLEVAQDTDLKAITAHLEDEGYVVNTPKSDLIMYLKGYTPRGFEGQAVHIHVRPSGDWGELYFRDYLILHHDVAAEYAKLKLFLKTQYPNDRDGYTEAKGAFVQRYTVKARAEFPGRYTPAVCKPEFLEMGISYKVADRELLEKIWNKNVENNKGDARWIEWKEEYICYNESNKCTTFLVLDGDEPVGEGTIIWSPECNAIAGRTQLADGYRIANINALRIEKPYEGQGHISQLIRVMESFAKEKGVERLTIGVEAKETRNLAIYLHWGFCNFVMYEAEENELVLYYEKSL
jgi:GrpB-like predicted nucleotidyltransferase (UPF0157 family)/GNAT superfamily N-acetyltransferase